jgi:hypothetical protein
LNLESESKSGKKLHESQSQADAEIHGARTQPVPAVWSFARILPEVPALPPLFPYISAFWGNPRSNQIELVVAIADCGLQIAD